MVDAVTKGGLNRLLENASNLWKIYINGGTIDGSVIGSTTPAAGTFSALDATTSFSDPTPVLAGSTKTLTAANAGQIILLDQAAGSVVTLPAATGTGNKYYFIIKTTVTSNSHKILAASTSDFIGGVLSTEDGGTTTGWYSDNATNHSIAMNGTTTGGYLNSKITLEDYATNQWMVSGFTKSTGTAATPFSTSAT